MLLRFVRRLTPAAASAVVLLAGVGCRIESPAWHMPQGYSDTYRDALVWASTPRPGGESSMGPVEFGPACPVEGWSAGALPRAGSPQASSPQAVPPASAMPTPRMPSDWSELPPLPGSSVDEPTRLPQPTEVPDGGNLEASLRSRVQAEPVGHTTAGRNESTRGSGRSRLLRVAKLPRFRMVKRDGDPLVPAPHLNLATPARIGDAGLPPSPAAVDAKRADLSR